MPTSAFTRFHAFTEDVAKKKHNLGTDQLAVALVAALNAPVQTNSVLANLTQIAYTNCSSRNVTTSGAAQTNGQFKLTLADLTLTAGGGNVGPFRYVVLYNDTALNDELLGFYDYGADITLADTESLLIDFSDASGALTIG